jgi:hypothetical protein
VKTRAPSLLAILGCGALTAAKLVGETAGVTRFHSEACFAMTAVVAPIPVWSGNTAARVRLNRGGNRQLDAALHRIVVTTSASAARAGPTTTSVVRGRLQYRGLSGSETARGSDGLQQPQERARQSRRGDESARPDIRATFARPADREVACAGRYSLQGWRWSSRHCRCARPRAARGARRHRRVEPCRRIAAQSARTCGQRIPVTVGPPGPSAPASNISARRRPQRTRQCQACLTMTNLVWRGRT